MYLVDTDWVISFLNGRPTAVNLIAVLAERGIALSVVTVGEILEGILGAPLPSVKRSQFDHLARSVDVIPVTLPVAQMYAEIRRDLRRRGLLIPDNDVWIAASARAESLTLVSRDEHFERISNLQLYQST
jgi:tRNA(fMet)-specific endonuclease VapC